MKVRISDRFYDVLKFIALYVLPGLASLYFGLSGIWGLPYPEQVCGTIMALDAFLGAILGLAVAGYNQARSEMSFYTQKTFLNPDEKLYPFQMSSNTYKTLYWIAQIFLPAAGALYFAISGFWGLPFAQQIVGTISLVTTFLGLFLGINTAQYKKYHKG